LITYLLLDNIKLSQHKRTQCFNDDERMMRGSRVTSSNRTQVNIVQQVINTKQFYNLG